MDTFQANRALGYRDDGRDYTVAAEMLRALGVERIDLMTNNPDKVDQLTALGVAVQARIPTGVHVTSTNRRYLAAKAAAGHQLGRAAIAPCLPPTARDGS
jgi:GTP cyclohydrolase II